MFPLAVLAHPGIGIVKDSKGNIYYTDLSKVWKISNGKKTVLLEGVHTHELYIDSSDNLFGEHVNYHPGAVEKWTHYLWKLSPDGKLDTIVSEKQAYVFFDYSLARDVQGNEYYIKSFDRNKDTNHIYKYTPDGKESIIATGNFSGVRWLHPQKNGSVLYVKDNDVYHVTPEGINIRIAESIGNETPSFPFSGNSITVWGVWQDDSTDVYVAVFSDQAVKKITRNGSISEVYRSKDNWSPIHGVFDNAGRLWVMECSDKNEIRVVQAYSEAQRSGDNKRGSFSFVAIAVGVLIIGVLGYILLQQKLKAD